MHRRSLLAVAVALLLVACVLRAASAQTVVDPGPGTKALPLSADHWIQVVTGGDEQPERLERFEAGMVYLLDFWATWCPPCIAGMEGVSAFAEEHRARGLEVLAITDEPLAPVVRFLRTPLADGRTQFDRFRTSLAADPDGSVVAALVPAEFRTFRPFAVVVGKDGVVEWMGAAGAEAKTAALEVLAGTWDRAAFARRWSAQRADQRERNRIQVEEDWAAARARYWDDAGLLGKVAFRIAFDFGGTVKNRDLEVARVFAERAVALTGRRSAYELSVLAKVQHQRGEHVAAVATQREALGCLPPEADSGFYRRNLADYEAAAGKRER